MDIREIGRMIYTLRKEMGISQEELCRGICSVATLSRLEMGECRQNILVFNAILERLGKSTKRINAVLTLEEFEYFVKRRNIEISLLTEDFEQAEKEIQLLEEELREKGISLQRQDAYRLHALFWLQKENNYEMAEKYVYKALSETISDFDLGRTVPNYLEEHLLLCETELHLLLLYAYLREDEAVLLENIFGYIGSQITDEKARNREMAKTLHLQAYRYKKKQLWNKCYQACEASIETEVKNSGIVILFQALKMEIECLENGVWKENSRLRKKQYYYLKKVIDEYGENVPLENYSFFTETVSQAKSLIDEVIYYSRIRGNYTQEELSEGICAPETLSRIETGRRNPTVKNFYAFMKKSGVETGYYNTEFVVERFETWEKIDSLRSLTFAGKQQEADELLKEIEAEIDITKNQQQLGIFHAVYDNRLGRITTEEALERTEALAKLTLKKKDGKYEIPYQVTFVEISILNQMAVYYSRLGRIRQAIEEIFMPLYEHFQQSKLEAPELGQHYFVVVCNLAVMFEEIDELEKAMEFVEKSLALGIKYNRGGWLGHDLWVKGEIQEKMGEEGDMEFCRQGYCLSELYEALETQEGIRSYALERWKIDLNNN